MAPKKTIATPRKLKKPVRRGKLRRDTGPTLGSLPVAVLRDMVSQTGSPRDKTRRQPQSLKTELKGRKAKNTSPKKTKGQAKKPEGIVKKAPAKSAGGAKEEKVATTGGRCGDPDATKINGFPVAPTDRPPRVGEWPSVIFPPEKQQPEVVPVPGLKEVEERCRSLEAWIDPCHNRYLGDDFKDRHEINIRAVVKHWKKHKNILPKDGQKDDHTFWIDGKKVSRTYAMETLQESWAEPVLHGLGPKRLNASLVRAAGPYPPDHTTMGLNVYEYPRKDRSDRTGPLGFTGEMVVMYPEFNRQEKPGRPRYNWPGRQGMANTRGYIDTGCTVSLLAPDVVRRASMYWDYRGPTGVGGSTTADGAYSDLFYRWFHYYWVQPHTGENISDTRAAWFNFVTDWQNNQNPDIATLLGLNVTSHDTWVMVRGTPTWQYPPNVVSTENYRALAAANIQYLTPEDYPLMLRSVDYRNFEDIKEDDPAGYDLLR